jgi:hypothetical protein
MGGATDDTTDGKYFKYDVFYTVCDTFNAIKTVLTSNGNRFGLADMAAGFTYLLNHGVSAAAAGGRYGGGTMRHDGLSLATPFGYSPATGRTGAAGALTSIN